MSQPSIGSTRLALGAIDVPAVVGRSVSPSSKLSRSNLDCGRVSMGGGGVGVSIE